MICEQKKQYSKKDAQTTCNYQMSQGEKSLRIYQCPTCGFWHLTHKTDWKKKNYNRRLKYKH